jgi:DNA polymerase elongation subunit (family B)
MKLEHKIKQGVFTRAVGKKLYAIIDSNDKVIIKELNN